MKDSNNIKFEITKSVAKAIKTPELKGKVLKAATENEEALREIKRVFKVANERVRQLVKEGIASPSLISLQHQLSKSSSKYNAFNAKGKDWYKLRMEYSKAVQFIQDPTSTKSGAKQWINYTKKKFGLSDEEWKNVEPIVAKRFSGKEGLIRSKQDSTEVAQEIYSIALRYNASRRTEQEAINLVKKLESNVETFANHATKEIEKAIENNVKNGFKIVTKRE